MMCAAQPESWLDTDFSSRGAAIDYSHGKSVVYGCPGAERRQNVATAEGRGLSSQLHEPRSGDRIFRRSAALRDGM